MNNRTAGDNRITVLYERLSRDDELAGDSSIVNQKKMLEDYAKNNGYTNTVHFTEPIIDRETFGKVQERFRKSGRKWKRSDHHVLVGRVTCGCCGHNLRHSTGVGQPYYWCPGLNIYHMDECVKRIENFYLKEVILFQIQQHIMELGKSDKLLQAEKKAAEAEDKVRELNRMKVHECFAVTKLTKELLDECVESIEIHPGNEVRISWK